jgi:hypothetical protein
MHACVRPRLGAVRDRADDQGAQALALAAFTAARPGRALQPPLPPLFQRLQLAQHGGQHRALARPDLRGSRQHTVPRVRGVPSRIGNRWRGRDLS